MNKYAVHFIQYGIQAVKQVLVVKALEEESAKQQVIKLLEDDYFEDGCVSKYKITSIEKM